MRRLITICILLISFAHAKSQVVVNGGDTITVTGTTSPSATTFGRGYCQNNGVDTVTMSWQLLSDSAASGWLYTGYCDKNLCYSFTIGTTHSFLLAPGASGVLQLDLVTGCNPGSGYTKILLWNKADSAGTVRTVTDLVTIAQGPTCPNGIGEIEPAQAQVSFYPNPVRSQLKVTLSQNISNGQIDIYNLLGSKVYSQPIASTVKDMDLSSLDNGLYVLRISENGRIIATRKFTKED
jgi:Secretion system C-terminal sorting domain